MVRINHVITIRTDRMDRDILVERAFCALWVIEQGILHLERMFDSLHIMRNLRSVSIKHSICTARTVTHCDLM